jgi:hypothetical protein
MCGSSYARSDIPTSSYVGRVGVNQLAGSLEALHPFSLPARYVAVPLLSGLGVIGPVLTASIDVVLDFHVTHRGPDASFEALFPSLRYSSL